MQYLDSGGRQVKRFAPTPVLWLCLDQASLGQPAQCRINGPGLSL
jgi:hypothetical protein